MNKRVVDWVTALASITFILGVIANLAMAVCCVLEGDWLGLCYCLALPLSFVLVIGVLFYEGKEDGEEQVQFWDVTEQVELKKHED